ncbi:hypothetical protein [Sporosarcina highlanderae]|uniref:Transporter n=1 Tax=Sporosarcina highlanderae TaxID=3035916 RepID=A0ABT8JUF0_9BACL|nr:hypothetical protein [Sporosarcina highlanderae]MDN4608801.1 hypothetical protein [Sporosarcina highlanderae]
MSNSRENELWYPKLPEGYTGGANNMNGNGMDGWMPGAGMSNYGMGGMPGAGMSNYGMDGMPWMGMPNYGQDWGYGGGNMDYTAQRFGPPGFPPGQGGFPGGGFPGQGGPGFPGGGFPGGGFPGQGGPSFPGGGFPGQGGGHQAPTAPPPSYTPAYPSASLLRVDPGAIRGCLFRYTFIWTSRRNGFWYFPTFVGRTSVAGYRWNPNRRRWQYFGIDLNRIDQFTCF